MEEDHCVIAQLRVEDRYLAMLERMLSGGIDVLAPRVRAFEEPDVLPPETHYAAVADLLRAWDTTVEVNDHGNAPGPELFGLCLERGVKLSFGGDAHHLCEIGDFACHLQLLRDIGFDGDLSEILVNPHAEKR